MLISEHVMKYHFADISLNKSLSRSFMKINIIHDFRDSVPVHFFFFSFSVSVFFRAHSRFTGQERKG